MIDQFINANFFLSNFYESPIEYEGIKYATVEHAYQATKTNNIDWKQQIQECSTPGKAKRMGKICPMRPDWEDMKVGVMRNLLVVKFQDPILKEKLIATGSVELIEGNNWGDRIWGQVKNHDGVYEGLNLLGKLT